MKQLTTAEIPHSMQLLFTEIQQAKTPLTVWHNGEPLVVISPALDQNQDPAFDVMKVNDLEGDELILGLFLDFITKDVLQNNAHLEAYTEAIAQDDDELLSGVELEA